MTLDLDQRQRAMLAEMRVPVWSPAPQGPAATTDSAVVGRRAPAQTRPPEPGSVSARVASPGAVPDRAAAVANPRAVAGPEVAKAGTGAGAGAAVSANAALADPAEADVARMDWPALAQTVRSCKACGLCEGRTAAVFAAEPMPVQADWLVVGEPPDAQEEQAGEPFAGPAGLLLDNMLRAVHVRRGGQGSDGARVTNVVKCRPDVARNPQREELQRCAVYLRREIALTRPRVILAMGRFAAWSLLAQDYPQEMQLPYGQLRGRVFRAEGVPVVVTYHPAKLLRTPLEKASAWADLCLARSLLCEPG